MYRGIAILGAVLAFSLAGATSARAATIVVGDCYTGGCNVLTGSVLVNVTNAADAGPNDIGRVYVEITNNTNGFISELGLFYAGGFPNPTSIEGFQQLVGAVEKPEIGYGSPNGLGNISQTLNFSFEYATSNSGNGAKRFNAGEKIGFYLDSASNLFAASFTNAAYAHVQAIGTSEQSAKIQACGPNDPDCNGGGGDPVPEPATLAIFGLGLLGAGAVRRRTRK